MFVRDGRELQPALLSGKVSFMETKDAPTCVCVQPYSIRASDLIGDKKGEKELHTHCVFRGKKWPIWGDNANQPKIAMSIIPSISVQAP
jgi:hypothetical protein